MVELRRRAGKSQRREKYAIIAVWYESGIVEERIVASDQNTEREGNNVGNRRIAVNDKQYWLHEHGFTPWVILIAVDDNEAAYVLSFIWLEE